VRHRGQQAGALEAASRSTRHLGRDPSFVEKDQFGRIERRLLGAPCLARFLHVRPLLLAGVLGFF